MAYVRPIQKNTWYLTSRSYALHMLQELTSVFVGAYALILLWGISAVAGGPESYAGFLAGLTSPLMLAFHWLAVLFLFYHAIAWFSVTPKAMPLQIGEEFLSGTIIAGAHYAAWVLLSLIVLFLAGVF